LGTSFVGSVIITSFNPAELLTLTNQVRAATFIKIQTWNKFGERKDAAIRIAIEELCYHEIDCKAWILELGKYPFFMRLSSEDEASRMRTVKLIK